MGSTALFILLILMEVYPQFEKIISLISISLEQSNTVLEAKSSEAILLNLQVEKKNLLTKMGNIVSSYDKELETSTLLTLLDSIALKSRTSITEILPHKLSQKDNLWLQPMELMLKGGFENIYNFVRFLENSEKVILINSIKLNPKKQKDSKLAAYLMIEVYLNI